MASDSFVNLIRVRDLTRLSIPLAFIRSMGATLVPDEADWWEADRLKPVPPLIAMGTMIVHHLDQQNVMAQRQSVTILQFFRDPVARYAEELHAAITAGRGDPQATDLRLPVIMLEVLEGRWAYFGATRKAFDVVEQTPVKRDDLSELSRGVYSHSVCLMPLYLEVYPLEPKNGANGAGTTEDSEAAG